ncbi:RHS repeat-associated core domain-containing protein [Proteus alimentorum]|nr:RHS repeat-associated core domain-containing protein [Proteus alimentorum]
MTKIRGRKTANGHLETVTTHYLPNIEVWEVNENPVTEKYAVVQINAGTSAKVRALCWEIGTPKGIENNALRYSYDDGVGNSGLETDGKGQLVSYEEYYPYGGTAIWSSENTVEADYKTIRYSGKEKDSTGLYYYGYRYYQPWIGRWLSADPAGTVDGLNLYRMVRNNPVTLQDPDGRMPLKEDTLVSTSKTANLSGDSAYALNTHHFVNKLSTKYKELTEYKKGFIYGISKLGKNFKIISTPDQQSEQLVISSHGGYYPGHSEISPPEGTTLHFLNPHQTYLLDPSVSNFAIGKNKTFVSITSEDTIPKTQNALDILNSQGLWGLSGSHSKGKVKDYVISKYESDTIESVAMALSLNREFLILDSNTVRSDFLIVRNRKDIKSLLSNVTLKSVLKELEKNGISYKNIICGFCRNEIGSDNETYDVNYHIL